MIDEINRKYKPKEESEEAAELLNLINTITELELKNKNKDSNFEPDDNVDTPNLIAAQELTEKDDNEETFYTGKLAIKENDYDDFKEIQDDINSNSIAIKILIFIFVIIIGSITYLGNYRGVRYKLPGTRQKGLLNIIMSLVYVIAYSLGLFVIMALLII